MHGPGAIIHSNYSISGTEDYAASMKEIDGGGYLPILHFLSLSVQTGK
jgi:hypothetical protein